MCKEREIAFSNMFLLPSDVFKSITNVEFWTILRFVFFSSSLSFVVSSTQDDISLFPVLFIHSSIHPCSPIAPVSRDLVQVLKVHPLHSNCHRAWSRCSVADPFQRN